MANRLGNVSHDHLRVCHVNCQSLKCHLDEFRHYFTSNQYHIICMSETWLTPQISDDFVSLSDYKLLRCDRIGRGGGGVGMYVHSSLRALELVNSGGIYCGKPEYILAEITITNHSKMLVCVVYRPPHVGYLTEFEDMFVQLSALYSHTIVLGDFNSDLNIVTHDSTHLRNFIDTSNLHLIPYGPTHHVRESSTFLDLCLVDDESKVADYGQLAVPFLSAHDLIHVKYKVKVDRPSPREFTCRDFRNFDHSAFLAQLECMDWCVFFHTHCVDDKVALLNYYLVFCLDAHAPIVKVKPKTIPAPWLTEEIKAQMSNRDRARREWRRLRTGTDVARTDAAHERFKSLRNHVQNTIRTAKTAHYNRIFSAQTDAASTWKELRSLGLVKMRDSDLPLTTSVESLNNFFASAGADSSYSPPREYYIGECIYSDDKFFFGNISYEEIDKALA